MKKIICFILLTLAKNAFSFDISAVVAKYQFGDTYDYDNLKEVKESSSTLHGRIGFKKHKNKQFFLKGMWSSITKDPGEEQQNYGLSGGIIFWFSSYTQNIQPYIDTGISLSLVKDETNLGYFSDLGFRFALDKKLFFYIESQLFSHRIYAVDKDGNDLKRTKTIGVSNGTAFDRPNHSTEWSYIIGRSLLSAEIGIGLNF